MDTIETRSVHNSDVVYSAGDNWVDVYYQGFFIVRLFRKRFAIQQTINHLENVLRVNGHDMEKWQSFVMSTRNSPR